MSKQNKNKEKEQSAERFIHKRKTKNLSIKNTEIQINSSKREIVKCFSQTFTGKKMYPKIFKYLHTRTYTVIDRWNEFT